MDRSSSALQSGRDYPATWEQFLDWFPNEQACLRYLEQLRWPAGFLCSACAAQHEPLRASRNRLICRACRQQCSVTAGTIFSKTRTPLRSWFAAVWHITSQKHGVSASDMQRVLELGSYQTAWTMLHRLRRAMVTENRDLLSGVVEIDETLVEGPGDNQSVIVIAVELKQPKGLGRIRLQRIREKSETRLLPFVTHSIKPGSILRTADSLAYKSLARHNYTRETCVQSGSSIGVSAKLPGVHRVASLLKRWILDTHQGSIQPQHIDYYLDEYCFRFNHRTSRSRGLLFYRLLDQAVTTDPVTYDDLTAQK